MDQQELQNTIAKYYQKLSPRLQGVFSSMNWLEIIKGIKEKNGLNEDQIETLSIETTLLLLAIISKEEYESIIKKDLGLESAKVDLILKEINAFILNTIELELRENFEKNQDELLVGDNLNQNETQIEEDKNKDIASDLNYQEKVYQIGKENNLTVAQITKLAEIVGDILSGKIFGDQFLGALSSLDIEEVKKNKIVNEINNTVFKEIRNNMMGKKENKEAETPMVIKKDLEDIKIENKSESVIKTPNSIINQKLTTKVYSNATSTNHSLPNEITENKTGEIKKIDPYREIPE